MVAHLCPVIGVMQGGMLVETLSTAELREGRTKHPTHGIVAEIELDELIAR